MAKFTTKRASGKPGKPRPDFPLFPHATGRWAKKVRGKTHYFGKLDGDPEGVAALNKWLDQKDDLLAGRTPRGTAGGLTVHDLCNRFLTNRRGKMESGELAAVSFADYHDTCARILRTFGPNKLVTDLAPIDFERFRAAMAKNWSPVTLGNEITRVRVVLHYAEQNQLIPTMVRYGSEFKKPSKKTLRKARQAKGVRMFEATDLRKIIDAASQPIKAMALLAMNTGFGNSDVANLTIAALDLDRGWVDFPRPKTGIPRRCPLWPETIAAIKEVLRDRPSPTDVQHADLLFITKYGGKWAEAVVGEPDPKTGKIKMWSDDPIGKEFSKVLVKLGLKRPGLSFYALRHTFETIGGDSKDQIAVDAIMGHVQDDMASVYRERIDDSRLQAVTEHVHGWLFSAEKTHNG
jgi:integrase